MKRCTTTRAAEAVFVTKCAEEPVIICISDTDNVDLIGPPDPVSNLRPVVRKIALHETFLQQKLRVLQDETQAWNQHFWSEHNKKFIKVKLVCIISVLYLVILKTLRELNNVNIQIFYSPTLRNEKKYCIENLHKVVKNCNEIMQMYLFIFFYRNDKNT